MMVPVVERFNRSTWNAVSSMRRIARSAQSGYGDAIDTRHRREPFAQKKAAETAAINRRSFDSGIETGLGFIRGRVCLSAI